MKPDECRWRFASQQVARLATIGREGPHLVPVVFAVANDRIVTAIDQKPKRTARLQRLANIESNPSVSLLADRYDDDWARLWWVRADGNASVAVDGHAYSTGVALLIEKYVQYRDLPPVGPLIDIDVEQWTGWKAAP